MRHASVLTAAILFITGSAIAGPLEDGTAAQTKGDYASALQIFRPLAEQENADAQLLLGIMFVKGQGVSPDLDIAQTWFKRAAENPEASKEPRADATYNRDLISRKLKQWADADAAAARDRPAEAAAARQQLEASRSAEAAAQRLQELQEENERARGRILKQAERDQRENARRREALDSERERLRADRDQAAANLWDAREKARRRANGGTGF